MTDSHKRIRKNCICISILLLAGAGLALYLVLSGYEPSGGDIWGHLYKSQEMYESLKKGNVFPLFSPYWYNGIQLFRYWGPLSYYIMAGLMFLTGGDLLLAYRLLAFVIFVVGGLPWILWGIHENRRVPWNLLRTALVLYAGAYQNLFYSGKSAADGDDDACTICDLVLMALCKKEE